MLFFFFTWVHAGMQLKKKKIKFFPSIARVNFVKLVIINSLIYLFYYSAKLSELTSSHLGGGEEDGVLFDDVSEDEDDPMD